MSNAILDLIQKAQEAFTDMLKAKEVPPKKAQVPPKKQELAPGQCADCMRIFKPAGLVVHMRSCKLKSNKKPK